MNNEQSYIYNVIDTEGKQEKTLTNGFFGFNLFLLLIFNTAKVKPDNLLMLNIFLGVIGSFLFCCCILNVGEKYGSLKHSVLTKKYNTVVGQYLYSTKDYAYFTVDNTKYQVYFVPEELKFLKENCLQGTELPLYAVATGNNNLSRIYGCLASCYSN